jgi:hypothetical protein
LVLPLGIQGKKNKIKTILQNLPNTAPLHRTLGTALRGVPHFQAFFWLRVFSAPR